MRGTNGLDEVIAMPIVSTETDQPIAAIVVGFKPIELGRRDAAGITNGIWLNGRLHLPAQSNASPKSFDDQLREAIESSGATERSFDSLRQWRATSPLLQADQSKLAFPAGIRSLHLSAYRSDRAAAACALANRWTGRNRPARRVYCRPFRFRPAFGAGEKSRSRLRRRSGTARARRSRAWKKPIESCKDRLASPPTLRISSKRPSRCCAPGSKNCDRARIFHAKCARKSRR